VTIQYGRVTFCSTLTCFLLPFTLKKLKKSFKIMVDRSQKSNKNGWVGSFFGSVGLRQTNNFFTPYVTEKLHATRIYHAFLIHRFKNIAGLKQDLLGQPISSLPSHPSIYHAFFNLTNLKKTGCLLDLCEPGQSPFLSQRS
jgi:hypothetical protein